MIDYKRFLQEARPAARMAVEEMGRALAPAGLSIRENEDYAFEEDDSDVSVYEKDSVFEGTISVAVHYENTYAYVMDNVSDFDGLDDVLRLVRSSVRESIFWAGAMGVIEYVRDLETNDPQGLHEILGNVFDNAEVKALLTDGDDLEEAEDFARNFESFILTNCDDPVALVLRAFAEKAEKMKDPVPQVTVETAFIKNFAQLGARIKGRDAKMAVIEAVRQKVAAALEGDSPCVPLSVTVETEYGTLTFRTIGTKFCGKKYSLLRITLVYVE